MSASNSYAPQTSTQTAQNYQVGAAQGGAAIGANSAGSSINIINADPLVAGTAIASNTQTTGLALAAMGNTAGTAIAGNLQATGMALAAGTTIAGTSLAAMAQNTGTALASNVQMGGMALAANVQTTGMALASNTNIAGAGLALASQVAGYGNNALTVGGNLGGSAIASNTAIAGASLALANTALTSGNVTANTAIAGMTQTSGAAIALANNTVATQSALTNSLVSKGFQSAQAMAGMSISATLQATQAALNANAGAISAVKDTAGMALASNTAIATRGYDALERGNALALASNLQMASAALEGQVRANQETGNTARYALQSMAYSNAVGDTLTQSMVSQFSNILGVTANNALQIAANATPQTDAALIENVIGKGSLPNRQGGSSFDWTTITTVGLIIAVAYYFVKKG